jgi:hypothetical protein
VPDLTRWAVRAALLYLALGFTFGGLLLANKGIPFAPAVWRLRSAHIEFLLIGWTAQLALAVAHWIIPRFRGGDFGRRGLAQLSFLLLNGGVLLVGLGPLLGAPAAATLAGRLLEVAAVLSFAVYIWPRIRPLGRR